MGSKQAIIINWFRKGLRLHDNPALVAAVEKLNSLPSSPSALLMPIFILDKTLIKTYRVGPNRWRFLLESLADLDKSLRSIGSRLYVLRGDPISQFEFMLENWNVKFITYEADTEPYAKKRDVEVYKLAEKAGVEIKYYFSHTLYEPSVLLKHNKNEVAKTYEKMRDIISKAGPPPEPVPVVTEIYKGRSPPKDPYAGKYELLTLKELNIGESQLGPHLYPGGETEALKRMKGVIARKAYVSNFEKPKTSPNSLQPSTTVLSPYLKFGCLSARLFYQELTTIKPQKTQPPVSLIGQLFWREFFNFVGCQTPNFNKMVGNPLCKQIPWDKNPEYLDAWAHGRTGYPFIDAIMTQLRTEGWIHHLARHAVACFLTRGDLWQSWEDGQAVFEELLLDADFYLNAANWMWLSASAFFHQYYRVYSPIAFGKKTDPHGDYIRKYIPKLKKFPDNYIYEPWTAPLSVQKAAGCIIGTDYPKPIVDHAKIHKINLERMNAAYKKSADVDKKASGSSKNSRGGASSGIAAKKARK